MERAARGGAVGACEFIAIAFALAIAAPAWGNELLPPEKDEERAIRQTLTDIEKNHPEKAAEARKTLEGLDKPSTTAARQLRNRRERGARRIVNGIHTVRHSAVAAVLSGNDPSKASPRCTGTLVGCNQVLTAAHCISKDPSPDEYMVFFPSLGFYAIKSVSWPKDEYKFPYADLALLTLEKAVEGISPIRVNTSASPIKGSVATIVGYGRTGGNRYDYGIKREGSVKFGQCKGTYAERKLLCWDYDADVAEYATESNTCNADSGGGVFMFDREGFRKVQRVVGVVSGGIKQTNCVKADHSYNTDVYLWREWLEQAVGQGGLSNDTCGAGKIDAPENLRSALATLSAAKPEAKFTISIPPNTASFRVAMNGEVDREKKNDFDLVLTDVSNTKVCSQSGPGQYAFCQVANPESGNWSIAVRRKKGAGEAQVTVTLVPQ